jgi:hypothetical protein
MESQVLSGSLTMRAFSGEGSFEISSGNIDLDYAGTFRGSAVYRFKRGYSPDPSQGSVF